MVPCIQGWLSTAFNIKSALFLSVIDELVELTLAKGAATAIKFGSGTMKSLLSEKEVDLLVSRFACLRSISELRLEVTVDIDGAAKGTESIADNDEECGRADAVPRRDGLRYLT